MRVRYLSLTNFRNFARLELALPERPLLLHGANAQGKTSLLEAIYLLATGSSPLTSLDRQLIKWEAGSSGPPYLRAWAEISGQERSHEVEIILEQRLQSNGMSRLHKTIRVDRVRKHRADLIGLMSVGFFMPQSLELASGPPAARRRYLNDTLCQADAAYCRALEQYSEAVRQRNATLRYLRKEGGDPNQLAPFEDSLAHSGVLITDLRRALVVSLSQLADRLHRRLTGGAEWLRLEYQPSWNLSSSPAESDQMRMDLDVSELPLLDLNLEEEADGFRRALVARRAEEIARGLTLIGPHRDEMRFVAGSPAQGTHEVDLGIYGSRGQQRTAVLALKLAELEWIRGQTGQPPVLLLDEVLAELDVLRRRYLLAQVDSVEQALLTATDPQMFSEEFRKQAVLWEVRGGIVNTAPPAIV